MSSTQLALGTIAVATFCFLFWCYSIARRLGSLERASKLDPLTGLGTGQWLETERWQAALRSGLPLTVAYIDLDRLKFQNDRYGHAIGDRYIQAAADALRLACRRGVDEVFRAYASGDEFILLLHGPIVDLPRFCQSLLRRLHNRDVQASIGVASTAELAYLPARTELKNLAEAACRRAKKCGGDCVILADGGDLQQVPPIVESQKVAHASKSAASTEPQGLIPADSFQADGSYDLARARTTKPAVAPLNPSPSSTEPGSGRLLMPQQIASPSTPRALP